jgi:predicted component of type VI protein secretion system
MDGNDRLEELLQDVMSSTEKVEQLAKDAGVEKPAAEGEETKKEE